MVILSYDLVRVGYMAKVSGSMSLRLISGRWGWEVEPGLDCNPGTPTSGRGTYNWDPPPGKLLTERKPEAF